MRRLTKTLGIAAIAGAGYAYWRTRQAPVVGRITPSSPTANAGTTSTTAVAPGREEAGGTSRPGPPPATASDPVPWVEPLTGGACPDGYPVKAKLASGIFHVPGGRNYDRTKADRCYRDTAAAEADGLRGAQA